VTQAREVKIFVRRRLEPDPELELLTQIYHSEPQAPRPAPSSVKDIPTLGTGGGGPPPTTIDDPQRIQNSVTLGKSQRTRRPPRYLADYHVGHMELPSLRDSTASVKSYLSNLAGNHL